MTRVPKRWNFFAAHCCRRIHQCSSESNLSYFRRTPFGSLERLHVAFTADSNIENSQWNSLSLMSRTITLPLIVGRGLSCNPWEIFPMQLEHIEPFLFKSEGLIRTILWQQRKLSRTILKDIYSNQIAFPELSHHTYTSNPCKKSWQNLITSNATDVVLHRPVKIVYLYHLPLSIDSIYQLFL